MILVHIGQVAEEQVDGHMVATAALGRADAQVTVVGRQAIGRRNHIDMIALDRYWFADLAHRHAGHRLDDPVGLALVVRRQVQHHHERHVAVLRGVAEKGADCFQAAGRGADADHGEIQVARAECRIVRRGEGRFAGGLHGISLVRTWKWPAWSGTGRRL
ncbi:hypothetical protein WR25_22474 [Diploscapter pachys]|uniref:Uncharacterized protein n=1 Tax=Diploscapter pachys TaxID=2018661 RepID=A0A2A2KBJ5_9BILA|nr:hypothetical protein WR25_22474 [Diploscapter pachys]